jgi:hypothetical protein
MENTGLAGPYILSVDRIDAVVTRASPGIYALDRTDKNDAFYISCIGRSDVDVAARLKTYVGGRYKYFKFRYSASAQAAFAKECTLYHDFNPPDNHTHPDRPRGTNWKCPVFGCDAVD